MDALAKATQALKEAKDALFELDMHLEWDMRITYVNSKAIKAMGSPRVNTGSPENE